MEKKKLDLKEIGIPKLIIIFLCGVFLIVLSVPGFLSGSKQEKSTKSQIKSESGKKIDTQEEDTVEAYTKNQEERLKNVLKQVEGIGETEVMLTVSSSKELVPLKDNPYKEDILKESDQEGGKRDSSSKEDNEETVLIANENGQNIPYIVKEIEPEVEGVVVIAQGGGNISTANEIVDAVQVLFDVPAHKIKVMKMNQK